MKKLFLLSAALFVAATLFCGCSKDDDNNFSTADIVGQWKLVRIVGYEIIDGIKDPFDEDYRNDDYVILFRADGTGKKNDNFGDFYNFTYEVKGNILSMTDDYGDVYEYTIEKLTAKELILLDVYGEPDDDYYEEEHSCYERM